MVITPASQAGYTGSIPVSRTLNLAPLWGEVQSVRYGPENP